eukprot:365271-Chlamydomonas_euryale.AAC.5
MEAGPVTPPIPVGGTSRHGSAWRILDESHNPVGASHGEKKRRMPTASRGRDSNSALVLRSCVCTQQLAKWDLSGLAPSDPHGWQGWADGDVNSHGQLN